jgi:hypothetical protein
MKYSIGLLVIMVIGVVGYMYMLPATMGLSDGPLPFYEGLLWKDREVSMDDNALMFCPKLGACKSYEDETIQLPETTHIKGYEAVIIHAPPIALGGESKRQQDFQNFYIEHLKSRGFVSGDLVVPAYAGHFQFGQYEKNSQVTTRLGRVKNGELEMVVVQTYTEDTSDCPDNEKNIFDGCNMNAGEHFVLSVVSPVSLRDIFKK